MASSIFLRITPGIALLLLSLGGCTITDAVHSADEGNTIIPGLRYVKYLDGKTRFEDISDGHPEIADEIENIPVADGPMTVDCTRLREIGVYIRHGHQSRGKWYGRHDYNYAVSWPNSSGQEPKHFTYEDQLRSWYLRGAARFLEPLSDGLLRLAVTHRGQEIYATEFNVVGCQHAGGS